MSLTSKIANWLAPAPPEPVSTPPPALSAAAMPPTADRSGSDDRPTEADWYHAAWQYYRSCGEARKAVDWVAHGISRCHLYIGRVDDSGVTDPEPVDDAGDAGEILDELHGGSVGQSAMLERLAKQLLVGGESWLIGYPSPPDPLQTSRNTSNDEGTAWVVASRREWQTGADGISLKLPEHPDAESDWVRFREDQVVVVPVRRTDPEDRSRSTSAFEAAIATLQEIDGLDARVSADIRSRLVSGGLYEIPESATMPRPRSSRGLGRNPLIAGIVEAARIAIRRPSSPEATLPIFYTVSDEAAGKARHIPLWSDFDRSVPEMRRDARQRLASVMDIPGEIIQGIADLNHWSSWRIDESAVKSHIGPLLTLICTTLTQRILWPALASTGQMQVDEIRSLAIWWDASEIILRPDRTREALDAHAQLLISDKAARRALSFTEDDAPDATDDEVETTSRPARVTQQPIDRRAAGHRIEGGQATPGDRPEIPQTNQRPAAAPAGPS